MLPSRRRRLLRLSALLVLLLAACPFTAPFATFELGMIPGAGSAADASNLVKAKLESQAAAAGPWLMPTSLHTTDSSASLQDMDHIGSTSGSSVVFVLRL